MTQQGGQLKLESVTQAVGMGAAQRFIIENCTFEVEAGSFTVIIGPSGCGKTTLMNLVAGYESPTRGSISIDGRPVTAPGPDRLLVFQETALFPWMTTLENVMYGPVVRDEESRGAIEARASELLRKVGLAQFAAKYPMQLSGGMQRRCELARALINNPAILLMDEPFRGLDHMTRELMQEYLLLLLEQRGGTVLFVTSEIDEAIFLGDRVLVLGNSPASVKADLRVDLPRPRKRREILASPRYAELKNQALRLLYDEAADAFVGRRLRQAAASR